LIEPGGFNKKYFSSAINRAGHGVRWNKHTVLPFYSLELMGNFKTFLK